MNQLKKGEFGLGNNNFIYLFTFIFWEGGVRLDNTFLDPLIVIKFKYFNSDIYQKKI